MRSTIERSSNCPPAPTMNQPRPGEPATLVQRPQEALNVLAVFDRDIDVKPVRAAQMLSRVGAIKSGTGGSAGHASDGRQVR